MVRRRNPLGAQWGRQISGVVPNLRGSVSVLGGPTADVASTIRLVPTVEHVCIVLSCPWIGVVLGLGTMLRLWIRGLVEGCWRKRSGWNRRSLQGLRG